MFIVSHTARVILEALETGLDEVEISLDLGLTRERLRVRTCGITVDQLRQISEDSDSIYFKTPDGVFMAAIRGEHFYKLFPTGPDHPPALMIDGVLMHRIKDIDPLGDARLKARHIPAHCSDVLDICTGLGYSALACIERGVQRVVTIERDPNVMSLARLNPWSRKLFDDDRVSIVVGDAVEEVARLEDERFCAVLHDPPRFGHAPSLYRIEFYSEIRRVLKPSGVLFHYVGSPGSRFRSTDVQKGVMNRLRSVGFVDIRRDVDTLGVVARKP